MNDIIKNIEAAQLKEQAPEFRVGDTVKVYGKIKEGNRERIQIFEGTVLKRQGGGSRETFTVRKTSNGIGVEKTWPVHSPNVEKVKKHRLVFNPSYWKVDFSDCIDNTDRICVCMVFRTACECCRRFHEAGS